MKCFKKPLKKSLNLLFLTNAKININSAGKTNPKHITRVSYFQPTTKASTRSEEYSCIKEVSANLKVYTTLKTKKPNAINK